MPPFTMVLRIGVEVLDDCERIVDGDVNPVRSVVEFRVEGLDVDLLPCIVEGDGGIALTKIQG